MDKLHYTREGPAISISEQGKTHLRVGKKNIVKSASLGHHTNCLVSYKGNCLTEYNDKDVHEQTEKGLTLKMNLVILLLSES